MDRGLTAADPSVVRRAMADAYLAAPRVDARLGTVRLRAHQVDAASRILSLLDESGGALLADATGLGKTYVAIAVARQVGSTVVVAPAALRAMWRDSLGRAGMTADVISYEACSRGVALPHPPDLVILDEAHHARNPRARRYAALARLTWGARVLLLTATPVHNRSRDVRALLALFLGTRAESLSEVEFRRLVVRRNTMSATDDCAALPRLSAPRWTGIPGDPDTLHGIKAIPPPVPTVDGSVAHALLQLGLIRAWTSSEFALRETLRRRLRRAVAFAVALEEGRRPDRRELAAVAGFDDAIQPALPGLLGPCDPGVDVHQLSDTLHAHVEGVRATLRALDRNANQSDLCRCEVIRQIRARHAPTPVVVFTQFADTARGIFRACAGDGGVALVTGSGARVASGSVTIEEIIAGFDIGDTHRERRSFPLDLLITTDVLSEGLSLRRAGVLVHLDLPWTLARLAQRVGRVRRMGSPYRSISVHAIGPPIHARELVRVIRALQRKARLSSGVVGASVFETGLPLLGPRLQRAIASVAEPVNCVEQLRSLLSRWREGLLFTQDSSAERQAGVTALALLECGPEHRLIAITGDSVSESVCDVYQSARIVSGDDQRACSVPGSIELVLVGIQQWCDGQRGRDLARPATDAPSPVHARVLNLLSRHLSRVPRSQRASSGARVQRLRELVNSARGAGAELALEGFADRSEELDLDALEQLLTSRRSGNARRSAGLSLVSLLVFDPQSGVTSGVMIAPGPAIRPTAAALPRNPGTP